MQTIGADECGAEEGSGNSPAWPVVANHALHISAFGYLYPFGPQNRLDEIMPTVATEPLVT